ncbi:MAG: hypothetical protein CMO80_25150 [Verrucomicrobiales bacterium]|nr:hypothetical protein [Verrucomicrobiales bacterium]
MSEEEKKSSFGKWLAIGCLGILALTFIAGILVVRGLTNFVTGKIDQFTDTNRVVFPAVTLSDEEARALATRVEDFRTQLDAGETNLSPLTLSGDEINGLIAGVEDLKEISDSVYISINSNHVSGQISIPVHKMIGIGKGRYLNGSADFSVKLAAGKLQVFADAITHNGKPLPDEFMKQFSGQNLAQEQTNAQLTAFLEKLDDIRIENGMIQFIPKGAAVKEKDEPKETPDPAKPEKADAPDPEVKKSDGDEPKQEGETKAKSPAPEPARQ